MHFLLPNQNKTNNNELREKTRNIFGKNLELLRVIHNLSQEEMSKRLNVSPPVYSRYESGEKEVDENNEFVKQVAAEFGITAIALVSKEINIKIFEDGKAEATSFDIKQMGKCFMMPKEFIEVFFKHHQQSLEQVVNAALNKK